MDDHHVYGDPFYAPPIPPGMARRAGPPVAPPVTAPPVTPVAAPEAVVDEPEPVVPAVTPGQPPAFNKSAIYGMRLEQLQTLCRELGLDASGKRPVLIARIKNHHAQPAAPATPPAAVQF